MRERGYFVPMGKKGRRASEPHPKTRELVGRNVSIIMDAQVISARDLAAKTGDKVDRRTIDRLKKGSNAPSIDTIGHLAEALGVAPDKLFTARQTSLSGKETPIFHGTNYQIAKRNGFKKKPKV